MKLNNIILSWDFIAALSITLLTTCYLPSKINASFCASFYNVGITVLSIIFSLFFAALAIIMASSDNEFIAFLEEEGDFTGLLESFKVTLIALFTSLVYSIVLYIVTDYSIKISSEKIGQNKLFFLVFEFIFIYSLTATAICVLDTIKFSDFRSKYIKRKSN